MAEVNQIDHMTNSVLVASPADRSLSIDEITAKGNRGLEERNLYENTRHIQYAWEDPNQMRHNRNSLDETNRLPHDRENPNAFRMHQQQQQRGHRRVQSGDSVQWAFPQIPTQQPYHLPNQTQPKISHSISMLTIATPQTHNYRYQSSFTSPRVPLGHSLSSDISSNHQAMEHLRIQTDGYVQISNNLQKAIRYGDKLTKEIRSKEIELDGLMTAETPSNRDCNLLQEELTVIQNEIKEMTIELDKLGIPFPGDTPGRLIRPVSYPPGPMDQKPPIVPADLSGIIEGRDDLPSRPSLARTIPFHGSSIRPNYPVMEQPPSYTCVYDPTPPYPKTTIARPSNPSVTPPRQPPPRPPRRRNETDFNEHWTCPRCTFDNLVVASCEMCTEPRPVIVIRPN